MAGRAASTGRWRMAVCGAAALLLLLPAMAMQVTDAVSWDAADFMIFGAMLGVAGGGFALAARAAPDRFHLAASALALATAFMLVWANLAVGVIGSEDDRANLLVYGVLAVAVAGAVAARLRARGMVAAMLAAALAQAGVAAVALAAGDGRAAALTLGFAGLWLTSAMLFRRSAAGAAA